MSVFTITFPMNIENMLSSNTGILISQKNIMLLQRTKRLGMVTGKRFNLTEQEIVDIKRNFRFLVYNTIRTYLAPLKTENK